MHIYQRKPARKPSTPRARRVGGRLSYNHFQGIRLTLTSWGCQRTATGVYEDSTPAKSTWRAAVTVDFPPRVDIWSRRGGAWEHGSVPGEGV